MTDGMGSTVGRTGEANGGTEPGPFDGGERDDAVTGRKDGHRIYTERPLCTTLIPVNGS